MVPPEARSVYFLLVGLLKALKFHKGSFLSVVIMDQFLTVQPRRCLSDR